MKKTIILLILIVFTRQASAQNVINPVHNLIKSTYENNMFSYRLFRDYTLIKSEIYENKIMADIDNTLSRFDNNLSYMTHFVTDNKNTQKHYMNLQLFWNNYRILILDLDNVGVEQFFNQTEQFSKLNEELAASIIEKRKLNSTYKDEINTLNVLVTLTNDIDKLLINYLYENELSKKEQPYKIDIKSINKHINKLSKTKYGKINQPVINDLRDNLSIIESLYPVKNNSKQMYSNINYFTKKIFILMNRVLSTIKK